jgi:hypothetical protein
MIEQSHIELMNRAIDGLTTADEREELRRILDIEAEIRDYYDRLLVASTQLKKTPRVPAPTDLKTNIMAKIATVKPAETSRAASHRSVFAFLREQWNASTSFHMSVGALAGAAAVVVFASVFDTSDHLSVAKLQGALMPPVSTSELVLGSGTIAAGSSSLYFRSTRSGNQLGTSIMVGTTGVAKLQVAYDPSDLAFSVVTANGQPTTEFEKIGDRLILTPAPGIEYHLIFQDNSKAISSLQLTVSDGHLSAREEISTGATPATE